MTKENVNVHDSGRTRWKTQMASYLYGQLQQTPYLNPNSKSRGESTKTHSNRPPTQASTLAGHPNPILRPLLLRAERGAPTPPVLRFSSPRAHGSVDGEAEENSPRVDLHPCHTLTASPCSPATRPLAAPPRRPVARATLGAVTQPGRAGPSPRRRAH
jgi:hypothetical protein